MMRIVGHLDMDAFFAAIEERNHPALRGYPIVVGADPRRGKGRGVVSTANYPARAYGIHSAIPISTAWRLSESAKRHGLPGVVFLPVDIKTYAEVSERIMAIIHRVSPLVEQGSIDEAFFDLTQAGSYTEAERICRNLKNTIATEEHLTASVGIGPNKLIAKIASGFQKPDGLTVVKEDEAEAFIAPLPVRTIPGIGPKTEAQLAAEEVRQVKDLKRFSMEELKAMLGKRGLALYDTIRGKDESPISEDYVVKSIGEQETFERDTRDGEFVLRRLTALCQDVMARLTAEGFTQYRTVVLTVRFADFETKTRAHTLLAPANSWHTLLEETQKLLTPFLDGHDNPNRKLIRLLGVRVEKLK